MSVKKTNILYISVILLTVLYLCSFIKSCSSTDKRELIKTALVNQKYKDSISSFELFNNQAGIIINKSGNGYILTDENTGLSIPADSKRVENLTKDLITIRNMYKLSDKIGKNSAFGLTDLSAFHIRYRFPDGIHEFIFGNQDFSLNNRFFMTDTNFTVYELDDTFDKYLSTSVQSWADPFLIFQEALGKITEDDIQRATLTEHGVSQNITDYSKLLELRHGGLADQALLSRIAPEAYMNIELGNKAGISLEFFPNNEDKTEYTVKTDYIKQNEVQTYFIKISSWTYNKIKETTL